MKAPLGLVLLALLAAPSCTHPRSRWIKEEETTCVRYRSDGRREVVTTVVFRDSEVPACACCRPRPCSAPPPSSNLRYATARGCPDCGSPR